MSVGKSQYNTDSSIQDSYYGVVNVLDDRN